jgi:hypothetical protein
MKNRGRRVPVGKAMLRSERYQRRRPPLDAPLISTQLVEYILMVHDDGRHVWLPLLLGCGEGLSAAGERPVRMPLQ